MLSTALIFAGLTAAGLVFTFKKLPKGMQEFMLKHYLLTEIITTLLTIGLTGTSLTGLMAGAIVGVTTSGLLHVREYPEKYAYLHVAGDWLTEQIDKGTGWLNSAAKKFRLQREENNQKQLVAA